GPSELLLPLERSGCPDGSSWAQETTAQLLPGLHHFPNYPRGACDLSDGTIWTMRTNGTIPTNGTIRRWYTRSIAVVGVQVADIICMWRSSDQSQFSHHFKRLVGVTPGQFRMSARNA